MYKNINIQAIPVFYEATCPKHGIRLFEVDDGWVNKAFFCPKCKAPYTIGLIKMKKWSKKGLKKALMDKIGEVISKK